MNESIVKHIVIHAVICLIVYVTCHGLYSLVYRPLRKLINPWYPYLTRRERRMLARLENEPVNYRNLSAKDQAATDNLYRHGYISERRYRNALECD